MYETFPGKIKFPFSLILFDYHNDMQIPLVHDLTSCGSWAGEVLFTHPYLEQLVLIGPDSRTIEEIPDARRRRLLCVSLQELEQHKARQALKKIPEHIPLYISIDKDVLGKIMQEQTGAKEECLSGCWKRFWNSCL